MTRERCREGPRLDNPVKVTVTAVSGGPWDTGPDVRFTWNLWSDRGATPRTRTQDEGVGVEYTGDKGRSLVQSRTFRTLGSQPVESTTASKGVTHTQTRALELVGRKETCFAGEVPPLLVHCQVPSTDTHQNLEGRRERSTGTGVRLLLGKELLWSIGP